MASIKRVGKDNLGVPVWEAVYRRAPGGKSRSATKQLDNALRAGYPSYVGKYSRRQVRWTPVPTRKGWTKLAGFVWSRP